MRNKKVLILTQPLGNNYGGILQAYALQAELVNLGYDAYTNIDYKNKPFPGRVIVYVKRMILRKVFKRIDSLVLTDDMKKIIAKNTNQFIEENIRTVGIFNTGNKPANSTICNYEAFIVGSDQVWRKPFSDVLMHLLDFTKDLDVIRISYAASFGLDNLSEYGSRLIKKSAKLAKKFNAISVREDSGVKICDKYWGVDAVQLIDPTLLLKKDDYINLFDKDVAGVGLSRGKIFSYVLDTDNDKKDILEYVSSKLKKDIFEISPKKPYTKKEFYENRDSYVLAPVTQWLRSFYEAEFIVTDSFHGCVFSIIFNKPFIAIGNKARGLTRFTSLLKTFSLEDRLIYSSDDLSNDLIFSEIDWDSVNGIIEKEQKRSVDFLQHNLNAGLKEN